MSKERYSILKSNKTWLNFTTRVCDECFVLYTNYLMRQPNTKSVPKLFKAK